GTPLAALSEDAARAAIHVDEAPARVGRRTRVQLRLRIENLGTATWPAMSDDNRPAPFVVYVEARWIDARTGAELPASDRALRRPARRVDRPGHFDARTSGGGPVPARAAATTAGRGAIRRRRQRAAHAARRCRLMACGSTHRRDVVPRPHLTGTKSRRSRS